MKIVATFKKRVSTKINPVTGSAQIMKSNFREQTGYKKNLRHQLSMLNSAIFLLGEGRGDFKELQCGRIFFIFFFI